MPRKRLVFLLLGAWLWSAAPPTGALQVTFPIDAASGDTRPRVTTLKPQSLRDYFDRFDMSYLGDVYRYGTYGDRSRAFRPDKLYQNHNFSWFAASHTKDGLDYEIKLSLRSVTDPAVSYRDDLHVTSFYSQIGRKDSWRARAGDIFPNLSRYTFNRFARGIQTEYQHDIGPVRLRSTGILSRVESAREQATLARDAIGAGLSLESPKLDRGKPRWFFGYRYASTSDELGSVDNAKSLADLQVITHGVLYSAQLPRGWSYLGENAWSKGTTDRRTLVDRGGYAWLADVSWLRQSTTPRAGLARLAPFAFQFNWELVDPYFLAPVGIASANQLRWSARTAHRFNDNMDWSMSFLRLQDNVRNQATITNISRTSDVFVNMRPFYLFGSSPTWTDHLPESVKDVRTRLEFRYNDRDATNGSVNAKTEDYLYTVLYKILDINFTGDYQFQITDDDASPTSERRLQAYGIRAAKPLNWKKMGVRVFPNIGYRINRDNFRITGVTTFLQTTTFGMAVNWEEIGANFTYLILDANRAPASNDYVQHKVNMALTYKPYLFPNFQSVLTYGYLDQNEENSRRSYRQTETRMTVAYTF